MSFVIGLCLVFAAIVGTLAYWLARRRTRYALAAGVLAFGCAASWLLHPVCVPLTSEDVARFDPPIETRTDTDLIGLPTFQESDGCWYQCKAWIARELFF